MKTICFIVPYFGKLPSYFQIWLDTCRANSSIKWLVFTDDDSTYNYPDNVEVHYCSFNEIRELVQQNYDFEIRLNTPYKLCDYKIAYGEIFACYLEEFDFWGFCDVDLMWGDIRSFLTEELLTKFVKIGCQGHSTVFLNRNDVNSAYKSAVPGNRSIKDIYMDDKVGCTDVGYITKVFSYLHLPAYTETIYAGLEKYEPAFYLQAEPKELGRLNRRQVFLWENGKLFRYYLDNGEVKVKEYLYIHFFSRPMKNRIQKMDRILIYPDCYMNYYGDINKAIIERYGKKSKLAYYLRVLRQNRKRLSAKKIISYFSIKMKYESRK